MNSLTQFLETEYLAVEQTPKLNYIIKDKFARLINVYEYILKCKMKVANIADRQTIKASFSYMVSINITMPEGCFLYALRLPKNQDNDSIEQGISDSFAIAYRKLIELKIENSS